MTLFQAFGQFAAAAAGAAAEPAWDIMTPTSIANSSGSASINTNGSVSFTGVVTVSLNGVFTSGYRNYVVVHSALQVGGTNSTVDARLRAAGSDATGASDYSRQSLFIRDTTLSAQRGTFSTFLVGRLSTNGYDVAQHFIFSPALARPTGVRVVASALDSNGAFYETAGFHGLSTAYDGYTLITGLTMTGNVAVYGVKM